MDADGEMRSGQATEPVSEWVIKGLARAEMARSREGEARIRLLEQACECYQVALDEGANLLDVFVNWGNALTDIAQTKNGVEADALFALAYAKYETTARAYPGDRDLLYSWGCALSEQAETKIGEDAYKLYELACRKFEAAIQTDPNDYESLHNWGCALFSQGEMRTGQDADRLFRKAEDKLARADALSADLSAFVLAELAAARDREADCRKWLTRAREKDFPGPGDRSVVEDAEYLIRYLDRPWLTQLLADL